MGLTDAQLNSFLSATRAFLIALGAFLATNGYGQTPLYAHVEMAAGAILVIGPTLWGMISAVTNILKAHAIGVQAGINLTTSGKALAADGVSVVSKNDGTTPPKPVTIETAQQIVKDFAPPPSSIANK